MKTTICIPDAPKPGHTLDKVRLLTDLEVLQTIAKFHLELNWETDDAEEYLDAGVEEGRELPTTNQLQLSVFPLAAGGSWFYGRLEGTAEEIEAGKVELLRTVVSRIAYCAEHSRGGSVIDIFERDEDVEDEDSEDEGDL